MPLKPAAILLPVSIQRPGLLKTTLLPGVCLTASATNPSLNAKHQKWVDKSRNDRPDRLSPRLAGTNSTHRRPVSVAARDFNEDGNQELMIANIRSNDVSIRFANGKGGFTGPQHLATGRDSRSPSAGYSDRDGHLGVAVANLANVTASILSRTAATAVGSLRLGRRC